MKSRKKPTALIGGLVLLMAVGFGFQAYSLGILKMPAPQPPSNITEKRESDTDASTLAKSASSALQKSTVPDRPKASLPKGASGANATLAKQAEQMRKSMGRPLMAVGEQNFTPTPNDAAVSGQWFVEGSRKKEKMDSGN